MGVKEILLERREKIRIEKGIEQGEAIWRHAEAVEIARKLKKEGLAIEFIAKTTKLPIEEIQAL